MDAIRFHGKCCLRTKLIGECLLNQLPSPPRALGCAVQRRHLDAAFLPIEMKPRLATFSGGFQAPADGEVPRRLLKRPVFHRIGHQFVQGQREGLNCAGAQPNAIRSVKINRSHISRLRGEFRANQFVERDTLTLLHSEEEVLHAGQHSEPVSKDGYEVVECVSLFQRLVC